MSELEAIPICPGHGHKKDIFHANPAVCPESPHRQDRQVIPEAAASCSWRVGPVWKLGGETCVCKLSANHPMPHECTCGAWFEGCGAK